MRDLVQRLRGSDRPAAGNGAGRPADHGKPGTGAPVASAASVVPAASVTPAASFTPAASVTSAAPPDAPPVLGSDPEVTTARHRWLPDTLTAATVADDLDQPAAGESSSPEPADRDGPASRWLLP
jgi:hypothetical protein